jgi:Co/Zn/Cd efflux system component
MQRTTFNIPKMDCASEEQLIRMKLEGFDNISSLDFDIPNRTLDIYHTGQAAPLSHALDGLGLGAKLVKTETTDDVIPADNQSAEKKMLWQVFAINLFFFLVELIAGFVFGSMGLVADSLDMLADSLVYGLALFAVGGTIARKKNIARASGYFQLLLAAFGLFEVVRRFIGYEETPVFQTMILVSLFALIGNSISLYLLQKSKNREAHMQASMIFTSNDVIANIGVIIAGGLVYLTASKFPDLIVGLIIFAIVGRGAIRILQIAKS